MADYTGTMVSRLKNHDASRCTLSASRNAIWQHAAVALLAVLVLAWVVEPFGSFDAQRYTPGSGAGSVTTPNGAEVVAAADTEAGGENESSGSSAASAMMIAFVGVGLLLLIFGRKLAKLGFALVGLLYGAVLGLTAGELFHAGDGMVPLVALGGAAVGVALTLAVYKFWIVLGTGAVFAYAVPATFLMVLSTGLVPEAEPTDNDAPDELMTAADEARQRLESLGNLGSELNAASNGEGVDGDVLANGIGNALGGEGAGEGVQAVTDSIQELLDLESLGPPSEPTTDSTAKNVRAQTDKAVSLFARGGIALRDLYRNEAAQMASWWATHGNGHREKLALAGIVGLVLGLLMGIFASGFASSVQTSLAGALLLTMPGRYLVEGFVGGEPAWLPRTPVMVLAVIGLITIAGIWAQYMIGRSKADEDE